MITSTFHVLILAPVFFALIKERALRRRTLHLQPDDWTCTQAVHKSSDCTPVVRQFSMGTLAYFAQAAKEARIEIVVNMSQISARREAKSHAAQDHWISEQVFNWSGVRTAHLRPTLFAEWALYWTDLIKTGTLRLPFGTGKHAPIAAEDQARVITKILLTPQAHKGKVYPLYGEKEYSFPEIAAEIGKVIGKPLGYEQVDARTLKRLARDSPLRNYEGRVQVVTDTLWQHFAEIAKDHQNGVFAGTNDLVEKIGGQRPIGLPEFLEAHRGALLS